MCPKCKFSLTKSIMSATTGQVGSDNSPLNEICPNDGTFMVPETYKMRCYGLSAVCEQLIDEMSWLDQHCSFVADAKYNLGPFKVGELRKLARAGIEIDKLKL